MNKVTFISNVSTPKMVYENVPEFENFDVKYFTLSDSAEKITSQAPDTEFIMADAMAQIGEEIISKMPKLKLIQSEGVGYQGIDIESCKRHGVIVANNKGINDTAVAECAVMLILACLKNLTSGQKAVYEGRQIEVKKASFGVVKELSQCTVGLVGFGDIARKTAQLLGAFGARVVYANRTRYKELEEKYNVEYCDMEELLKTSDFVSLHLAVCDATKNIANKEFFDKMKNDAYLINTARGDLVDNQALLEALQTDKIAGAGLDVISPEPVTKDNILLCGNVDDKLVILPHISGITNLTVKKLYKNGYDNIQRIINNEEPFNVVSR